MFTTLTIDTDAKVLIKDARKILKDRKNINFDIKDLVYLAFKRPEKVADLISENFSIDMTDVIDVNNNEDNRS